MPKHHAGSGPENRLTEKRRKIEETNDQRQQQHKGCWLPVGIENMTQGIEPDNFLLGVVIGLIRVIANGHKRVGMANNSAVGQPVRVPEYHAINQRKYKKHQQKAGDVQAIWVDG